eukprot:CAMPEP_0181243214 /NCGR_PEP_ID=MMETSP1096-20121128/42144_1 /TAXON_ID=156174 ORGANISM="Chrysochromulina ericina, Strain CCMP281" /NCGR_SAMPLE_ID=MMETSP1096 /ASSEMBLY_ACC=CAM_ASM_000453 /LENGTH=63 /DNA_ID=CAMNT_0023339555 /DNA_START=196 /DNA_END=387 /DNA_ORIENTATION=-
MATPDVSDERVNLGMDTAIPCVPGANTQHAARVSIRESDCGLTSKHCKHPRLSVQAAGCGVCL